jgi:ribose 5-phosphate isomerase B
MAKRWNDANGLALSLRMTTTEPASEILDAWFATDCSSEKQRSIDQIQALNELRLP